MDKQLFKVIILVFALSSLTAVQPVFAQSIPKPSVPEFSAQYIDYSYYVPPTYGIDQYTGKNVTIQSGYQASNRTVLFTINNQPFTPYTDSNGNNIGLYYNFRYKGHFGDTWSYYPFTDAYSYINPTITEQTTHSYGAYGGGHFIYYSASNSQNTIITIPLILLTPFPGGPQIPDGSQVDFQVQAQIGQINPIPSGLLAGDFYNFTGQISDWSNTQTLTIADGATSILTSTSPSPNPTTTATPAATNAPTPTPTVPEFTWLAILPIFISLLSFAVIIALKNKKLPTSNN